MFALNMRAFLIGQAVRYFIVTNYQDWIPAGALPKKTF
jgi:hypothetical protein